MLGAGFGENHVVMAAVVSTSKGSLILIHLHRSIDSLRQDLVLKSRKHCGDRYWPGVSMWLGCGHPRSDDCTRDGRAAYLTEYEVKDPCEHLKR